MLSFDELLVELKKRTREERLALLEEVARSLREDFAGASDQAKATQLTVEKNNGWPEGFFEKTYGLFRDDPLMRLPQGE